jgi:hypothetical protein
VTTPENSALQKFGQVIKYVERQAYIQHGLKGTSRTSKKGRQRLVFKGDDGERVTLSWQVQPSVDAVRWSIRYREPGQSNMEPDDLVKGEFPTRDPAVRALTFISTLAPKPPSKVIAPKGRLVTIIYSGTMLLALFALGHIFAVSAPPGDSADLLATMSSAFATMQQVMNSLSFADLPTVIVGTFMNQPGLGLAIIAAISFMFLLHTMPQIGLPNDVLRPRALVIMGITIFSAIAAIVLSPFPWNLVLLAPVAYYTFAFLSVQRVAQRLDNWLRFTREILLAADADSPVQLAEQQPDGHQPTFREIAHHLEEQILRIRKRLWKQRDAFFDNKVNNAAYFEVRTLKMLLAYEIRSNRRGRAPNQKTFRRIYTWDDRHIGFRNHVTYSWLPLGTVIAALLLMIAPTPWIAPSCMSHAGNDSTVYVLPGNPAFLTDSTRKLTLLTSWDGYSIRPGSCQ